MTLSIAEKMDLAEFQGGIAAFYGLRARPPGIGCIPDGFTALFSKEQGAKLFSDVRDVQNLRHGVVGYAKPLDEQIIKAFELIELSHDHKMELQYINSIPSCEAQSHLANELAQVLFQQEGRYAIDELKYDGEYTLKQAFKQLPVFANRKLNPALFAEQRSLLATLETQVVIEKVKGLIKGH